MSQFTNRLADETSPYLLQHANNPVDWYPWGEEAFEKAKELDRPVLVSIGYAACHWCHVMERESFEDPETASIMNEHFVNIKVDREERPDVDSIYMDAVQAISGSGGWPLNVFLTPDRRPFYGGTYYPPRPMFNRGSWTDVLLALSKAYRERKDEIEGQANQLTEHIRMSNGIGTGAGTNTTDEDIENAMQQIMKSADKEWGGFGKAPKFPQTFTITNLLHHTWFSGNEVSKTQALLSLDKMIEGGIYDQIGGGFARYSTDTEWLAPHFEKMLYDNALILSSLSEAFLLTGNENYRRVIEETLTFVETELMHPEGGFYSALDADSEGVEGKFYVWDAHEVAGILGDDAELFSKYYDIKHGGNWEHVSIPRTLKPFDVFVKENGLDAEEFGDLIERGKKKLMEVRSQRIRPQLDDKVLLGWNALMNKAYSRAFGITGSEHYRQVAKRNMDFLFAKMQTEDGLFFHTWKGEAKINAFLDDYSYLIEALIELSGITSDWEYVKKAASVAEKVIEHFTDSSSSLFFYTPGFQTDILVRKKEVYDGATPSGNAVMARGLHHLGILLDKPEWREKAEQMASSMAGVATKYPTSFGVWLDLLSELKQGTSEIAVVGKASELLSAEIQRLYIPYKLLLYSSGSHQEIPLLSEKSTGVETLIFLCRNYECKTPVRTAAELQNLIYQNKSHTMQ